MKLALAALVALALQEPVQVPIAWTLKKGEKLRYEMSHKTVTKEGTIDVEGELALRIAIEAGDDTAATLTLERIAWSRVSGEAREDYDSARDAVPPEGSMSRVLSKCVGQSVAARISPAGKLEVLEELRKLVQSAVEAFDDLKGRRKWDADGVDVVARKMEWLLRWAFETPKGGPAAIGESWKTTFESKELTKGLAKATCTATLKEVRDGTATVEQAIAFEFPAPVAAGVKEASGKGTLTWDTKRGVLKSLGAVVTVKFIICEGTHRLTVALVEPLPK